MFVTMQESRRQLARIVERFGWSIDDPRVTILDRSPVDMYIDELIYEVLVRLQSTGARRVVVDSLNDVMLASPDSIRLREFLYSFVQRCVQQDVSAMLTYETMELFRMTLLSEVGMSHIADNVVLLQHYQDGPEIKRALAVLKSRGSQNSNTIREFKISASGITLGDAVDLSKFQT